MGDAPITVADKLACAEREVKQRERVYPRFVADGRMTQAFADRQLAVMRAIVDDYAAQAQRELLL